jgi:aspartate--ammonia ligase
VGPGIGDYIELEKILPSDYHSLLTPKETQRAIFHVKRYIEDNLCTELNLMMVEVPLIVNEESGFNDMLDRDGSRTPIQFHISNDREKHPVNAQVVQAATKWKRVALKQFDCQPAREFAPTWAPFARIISLIMTTAPTSINGIGSVRSRLSSAILNS